MIKIWKNCVYKRSALVLGLLGFVAILDILFIAFFVRNDAILFWVAIVSYILAWAFLFPAIIYFVDKRTHRCSTAELLKKLNNKKHKKWRKKEKNLG